MEYTLQKVNWGNIGEAVCVEEETLPNSCYLRDNSDYFLNQTKGENFDHPHKFTNLYDNSDDVVDETPCHSPRMSLRKRSACL